MLNITMMEHIELLQEMQQIEKLTLTERVKLAQKRRKQQLTTYAKWMKTDSCSSRLKPKNTRSITFSPDVQLMEIAARASFDEMRTLLKTGVDPNMKNHDGLTALHQCCIDGSLDIVSLLLKHGAKVNITDQDLWTPLHAAATCGHFKIVTTLVKAGANLTAVNGDGDMPHDITEDEVTLQYLENEMAKRGITQDVISKIHHEPYHAMLRDINDLMRNEGDLDQPLDKGSTLLHVAVANGYNDIVKLLIEKGASVTIRDEDGWEPIHAAAFWCNEEALDILINDESVNLQTSTDNGETPYELCDAPVLRIKILNKISEQQNGSESSNQDNYDTSSLFTEEAESTIPEEEENAHNNECEDIETKTLVNLLHIRQSALPDNNKEDSHDYPSQYIDSSSAPLITIQTIELSSDRRNSIKEAKHKAPLKRLSSERLSNKEKHKIICDIEKRQEEYPSSSQTIQENDHDCDVPPKDLEEDLNVDREDKNNAFLDNNVEYNGYGHSTTATKPQETNKVHRDLIPTEQMYRISKKKMPAPPPPTGSLLDLKRQRRESRQLHLDSVHKDNSTPEFKSTFYDSTMIFEPPPSPTIIRHKYTIVPDDYHKQNFIREKKCTIM